ncbi:hypothetical protein J3B02_005959, partial [Coemansia erecta]
TKPNSGASPSPSRKQQHQHQQHQQQQQHHHLSTQGSPLLPSPLEASSHSAGGKQKASGSAFSYANARSNLPMLSAQTVTTTTVTTTTVTTYPPLKLPRVNKQKMLQPDLYPLASVPAPPALQQFALDMNDQQLYFSQNDMVHLQSGDILATIAENLADGSSQQENSFADNSAMDCADVPRAMTPLYTQDDATKHAERQMRQLMHKTPRNPLVNS